ncbi:MAG: prolipoprotein diacylglyceryl transferase [Oscillospiraceae bacterium]|nr:prolipoprotein diacylglyceryl transferase [Oscillospiraceae bacterium]
MHPFIHILGYDIPTYGVMTLLGIAAALGVSAWRCGHFDYSRQEAILAALIAIVGGMAGAILLRPLTRLPDVIINWERYSKIPIGQFFSWFFGDLVFYGGMIGGVGALLLYCSFFRMSFIRISDIFAPALPTGHAFGRVGCLFAGCCYGVETSASNPLAIVYPPRTDGLASVLAPTGVPLLALPLIEAVGNIAIACVVLLFQRKTRIAGRSVAVYGVLYSVFRFILEFFRGDQLRGVYGGISTSQIISIVVFVASVIWFAVISRISLDEDPRKTPYSPQT